MSNLQKYGSFDIEEATKAKEELDAGGGGDFMSLKVGRNVVRFLPPLPGKRNPFRTIHQHFIQIPGATGPVSFVCPRHEANRPCPACAEADRLRGTGNPADSDRAGELFARRRVFANVIDRLAPEKGPRVLGFGKTIHEQLLALRTDGESGGDFTHPESGFDIIIERVGTGKNDTKYSVRPARNNSPLSAEATQTDEWLAGQRDLAQYARVLPADELEKMLLGEQTAERQVGQQRPRPSATRAPADAPRRRTAQDDAIDVEG